MIFYLQTKKNRMNTGFFSNHAIFVLVQVTGLEPGHKRRKNHIKSGCIFICVIFRVMFY